MTKERGENGCPNRNRYGKLLSKVRPRVIRTEAENERALAEPEALDNLEELERPLTREEVNWLSCSQF